MGYIIYNLHGAMAQLEVIRSSWRRGGFSVRFLGLLPCYPAPSLGRRRRGDGNGIRLRKLLLVTLSRIPEARFPSLFLDCSKNMVSIAYAPHSHLLKFVIYIHWVYPWNHIQTSILTSSDLLQRFHAVISILINLYYHFTCNCTLILPCNVFFSPQLQILD